MLFLHIVFWVASVLHAVATLLPFSKVRHGAIRGLGFPRVQIFWLGLVLIAAACGLLSGSIRFWAVIILGLLSVFQATYLVRYTSLWPVQSLDAHAAARADAQNHLSVMIANVKKSNRTTTPLIDYITAKAPHIAVIVEPDDKWIDNLAGLRTDYPHWISVPQDNGYGLCIVSKLAIDAHDVRQSVTQGIPSIRATVTLSSGAQCRVYAVHPEPPTIDQDTHGRDSEIASVGIEARDDALPAIVAGDFNDVSWSATLHLFQRLSGLLDPRVGRGIFSTFHADFLMFRWPLDHLYHGPRFRLMSLERGPAIGSDHFPILYNLALSPNPAEAARVGTATHAEEVRTQAMIAAETKRSRSPIGGHWEDEREPPAERDDN